MFLIQFVSKLFFVELLMFSVSEIRVRNQLCWIRGASVWKVVFCVPTAFCFNKQKTWSVWVRVSRSNVCGSRLKEHPGSRWVCGCSGLTDLCLVLEGSCRTLTRTERWPWTSSAPPSTWWWPERTATTFLRSCPRAWCQSWSTWMTQQVLFLTCFSSSCLSIPILLKED